MISPPYSLSFGRLAVLQAVAMAAAIIASPAQEEAKSADEIARELSNPNTALASMTFKNQFRFYDGLLPGSDEEWNYSFNFNPVFPFPLNNGDKIIWRPAIPFVVDSPVPFVSEFAAPGLASEIDFDNHTGLGDIGFDLVYAHTTESGLLLAAGLFTTLPTASSSYLGTGRWALGPEFLIGKLSENYVLGIFPNHIWDIAGWGEQDISVSTIQVFATWLPGGGWNVGTAPIMNYNWNNEQWTIPVNLTVGKAVTIGGKPWKISGEANYYFERSDIFGAEWMFGLNVTPVMKNPFIGMLR